MESLQTRYKHEWAYVNLVTQFDTASVNSAMVTNKNAINLRRKIFSVANFPCLQTLFAQNYFVQFFYDEIFRLHIAAKNTIRARRSKNCKFIAACFSLTFRLKSHGRAAPIRRFDFALCCIKRIVRYYPRGELTLTIFFSWTPEQENTVSMKIVCKNYKIRNKLYFFLQNIDHVSQTKVIVLHSELIF